MQFHCALALDIGEKRIGVARAGGVARLPEPLGIVTVDGSELDQLRKLIEEHQADRLVVGLPRNLQGHDTAQTQAVRRFGDSLSVFNLPIHWQDEALTSVRAESELIARRKPARRSDIDALAASYILEDWLEANR